MEPSDFCAGVVYPLYWIDLGWLPSAHQAILSLSLSQKERGREYDEKLLGQDKDGEIAYALP